MKEGRIMSIKIITDSTSYINESLVESLNIDILSLYVVFDEESIKEINIDNDTFYKRMSIEGIPTSSQPATGEILETMRKYAQDNHDIVGVFISSEMSGTYQSALMCAEIVKNEYPNVNIEIIDSLTNSMQLGFIVIEGARAINEGKTFQEVVDIINHTQRSSRFIFTPENLDYLHKGGRIGGAAKLLGNAVKLTPILTVQDGNADSYQTVRTKTRAKKEMIRKLVEDHEKYNVKEITIHHINAYDEASKYLDMIQEVIDVPMDIVSIGPVIGVHVGPGAIGIAYVMEEEIKD